MYLILLTFFIYGALAAPENRFGILEGQDASDGEFPYQIVIEVCSASDCSLQCGGVIVNEEWILTAAHCYKENHTFTVFSGAVNITDPKRQAATITKWVTHPKYQENFIYDISLGKLSPPLKFDQFTNAAKLPEENADTSDKEEAVATGWGVSYLNETNLYYPKVLQKVSLPIIDYKKCMESLTQDGYDTSIFDNNVVCSGPIAGGPGPCFGDSGGPLTQNSLVIGLVDRTTRECGEPGQIFIYDKVSYYISWINEVIKNNN